MISFEEIFDIENIVERAAMAVVEGNGYQEFSDATKRTPGYEFKFTGEPTGEKKGWKNVKLDRAWMGALETKIVTERGQNSDRHSELLVHARIELSLIQLRVEPYLPHHWITFVQEKAITRGHIVERAHDWSVLHHDLKIEVRGESWPAE
jgi:hypothetical protein